MSAGWGSHHPDLGWGTPLSGPYGVPPLVKKDGVPPPLPDLGLGTPSPSRPGMGYLPPPKVEQTHTSENITSRRTTYTGGKYVDEIEYLPQ